MKVQIVKVIAKEPKPKVLCATDYGVVSLIWMESNPAIGKIYEVELETSQVLQSSNICVSKSNSLVLADSIGGVQIIGDIDSLDDDGYMILRLNNYIIPFMTENIILKPGARVEVVVESMAAYPIEY